MPLPNLFTIKCQQSKGYIRMSEEKKHIHFISHTHWDREWYMPFEAHRFKLVEFFDRLLETLDTDPSFKSFHLDGQAIVIEDYLEVRPQMREKIEKYIADGRLVVGPWYILQDEYLVDGESNVRNMLVGRQVSAQYGKVSDIGYFPDAFGNIGQAPQILRGFDIDCVAFGRGVSERHGDRLDTGEENYGKARSEIRWRSPDGSEVNGAVFLRWYSNGNEIPSDPEKAAESIKERAASIEKCATTPHLLLMNGCDHQPVQTDIGQIIEKLNGNGYPDTLVHSNFRDYFNAILPYRDRFGIFVGELDGEYSDGWGTLANTASARIYLKQYNSRCEALLEKKAEPMSVLAALYGGKPADRDYFRFIWKELLRNHPHDSICGCSVDDVHSEMVTRFKKVLASGGELLKEEKSAFMSAVNTREAGTDYAVTVFNPTGRVSGESVTVMLDLPKDTTVVANDIAVLDGEGALPVYVRDCGVVFDYILPKDTFRVPFNTHRFELTFSAHDVPALGWKTFGVTTDGARETKSELTVYKKGMANRRLRVRFESDGSATVTDRKTGATYTTGIFVDSGDIGNEYIYRETADRLRVTTEGSRAKVELVSENPAFVTFKVTHTMKIPAGANLESRTRVGECEMKIEAYYTLTEGSRRLDMKTVIHNTADNHRVVMLTKHGISSELLMAEGQFDIVKREITPWEGWRNPTKPGKMTNFFGVEDEKRGVFVSGRGLNEYEVLRDDDHTLSLTLHRGVHELGDWGDFPTPEAQCREELTVEYSLVPYSMTAQHDRDGAIDECYSFAAYAPDAFCAPTHDGVISATDTLVEITGSRFIVSALKMSDFRDTVILRVFNPTERDTKMKLNVEGRFDCVYSVNLNEDRHKKLAVREGKCTVSVPAKKIVTIELVPTK